MARFYDIVCSKCGGVESWYKYEDLPDKCSNCKKKMKESDWKIFGVWSSSQDVERCSKSIQGQIQ